MFQRIRSRISTLPSLELSRLILKRRRRISVLECSKSQPLPISRILVQSVVSDVEAGESSLFDEGQQEQNNEQRDDGGRQYHEGINSCIHPEDLINHSQSKDEDLNERKVAQRFFKCKIRGQKARNGEDFELTRRQLKVGEVDLRSFETSNPVSKATRNSELDGEVPCFPLYLQTYFYVLYYLGLCPLKGNGTCGSKMQLVAFIIITGVGLYQSFCQWKHFIVTHAETGNLQHYITIWYFASAFLVQLYILKLFIFNREQLSAILKYPDQHQHQAIWKQSNRKFAVEPIISAVVIILMSIAIATRLDWLLGEHSFEYLIRSRSANVINYLFVWTKDDNATVVLPNVYEDKLNMTTILTGTLGIFMRFIGDLKENLIRDLLLMSALHILRLSHIFQASVSKILHKTSEATDENLCNLRETYSAVLKLANKVEEGFKTFFKVVHIESWLVCPYFLIDLLWGDVWHVYFYMSFIAVPKIILAYYISARAIAKSQAAKHLIEIEYDKKKAYEVDKAGVVIFLKVLEDHPIGIGRGQFQLDETFVSRFFGVVISCFLLLESSDKEISCDCNGE